jgi:hypothetical protein
MSDDGVFWLVMLGFVVACICQYNSTKRKEARGDEIAAEVFKSTLEEMEPVRQGILDAEERIERERADTD